jgi:hypothetical protein
VSTRKALEPCIIEVFTGPLALLAERVLDTSPLADVDCFVLPGFLICLTHKALLPYTDSILYIVSWVKISLFCRNVLFALMASSVPRI